MVCKNGYKNNSQRTFVLLRRLPEDDTIFVLILLVAICLPIAYLRICIIVYRLSVGSTGAVLDFYGTFAIMYLTRQPIR